jgi:hypothetical protein
MEIRMYLESLIPTMEVDCGGPVRNFLNEDVMLSVEIQ